MLHELRGRLGLREVEDTGDLRGRLHWAMQGKHSVTQALLLWLARVWTGNPIKLDVSKSAFCDCIDFLHDLLMDDHQVAKFLEEGLPASGFRDKRAVLLPWLARIVDEIIARVKWDTPGSTRTSPQRFPPFGGQPEGDWTTLIPLESEHAAYFYGWLEYGLYTEELEVVEQIDLLWYLIEVLYPWEATDWMSYLVDWIEGGRAGDWSQLNLAEALDGALRWHHEIYLESLRKQQVANDYGGRAVVRTWPDGWSLRRLETPRDLQLESAALGHCIRSYSQKLNDPRYAYYSVHDPDGMPRVSIEIAVGPSAEHPPRPLQVFGHANTVPSGERAIPTLRALVEVGVPLRNTLLYIPDFDYSLPQALGDEQGFARGFIAFISSKPGSIAAEDAFIRMISSTLDPCSIITYFIYKNPSLLTARMVEHAWQRTVERGLSPWETAAAMSLLRLSEPDLQRLKVLDFVPRPIGNYLIGNRDKKGAWIGCRMSVPLALGLVKLGADITGLLDRQSGRRVIIASDDDVLQLRAAGASVHDIFHALDDSIYFQRCDSDLQQVRSLLKVQCRFLPTYVRNTLSLVSLERAMSNVGKVAASLAEVNEFSLEIVHPLVEAVSIYWEKIESIEPRRSAYSTFLVYSRQVGIVVSRGLLEGTGFPFSRQYGYAGVNRASTEPKLSLYVRWEDSSEKFILSVNLAESDMLTDTARRDSPRVIEKFTIDLPDDVLGLEKLRATLSTAAAAVERSCRLPGSWTQTADSGNRHLFEYGYDTKCLFDGLRELLDS
jgi:hypothetical protein